MMETECLLPTETMDPVSVYKEVSVQKCDASKIKNEPCSSIAFEPQDNVYSNFTTEKCEEDKIKIENHHCIQEIFSDSFSADSEVAVKNINNKYTSGVNCSLQEETVLLQEISNKQFSDKYEEDKKHLQKIVVPAIKLESIGSYAQKFSSSLNTCKELHKQEIEGIISSITDIVGATKSDVESKSITDIEVKCENKKYGQEENRVCHKIRYCEYYCDFCAKSFLRKPSLILHLGLHQENIYKCDDCTKCFPSRRSLQLHVLQHRKTHQCLVCEKYFAFKNRLVRHFSTHSTQKTLKCGECEKWFTSKKHLSYHIKTIHRGRKFNCEICKKCFSIKTGLSSHMRLHTDERKFKCKYCNMCFRTNSSFIAHSVKHKNVESLQCETCRKSFLRKSCLLRHLKVHKGEKLHKCDICGKCFAEKCSVKEHRESIHFYNGVRYSCDSCGATTKVKKRLVRHFTKENVFQCDVCRKMFFEKCTLTLHMVNHKQIVKYKCIFCDKVYKSNGTLTEHVRIIHEGYRYTCEICGKSLRCKVGKKHSCYGKKRK